MTQQIGIIESKYQPILNVCHALLFRAKLTQTNFVLPLFNTQFTLLISFPISYYISKITL